MSISFKVPGIPQGKGRPRYTVRGGYVRTYTPAGTARYEASLVSAMKAVWQGREPLREPVRLSLLILFPRPKRMCWKRRPMPREPHTAKPDTDNVVKAVCDSLEKAGIVCNDSKIWSVLAEKQYASGNEEPGVFVCVSAKSLDLLSSEGDQKSA